jgi:hypothetical protein
LVITFNYPQITESYIEAEVSFLRERGVEVFVWSQTAAPAPGPLRADVGAAVGVPLDPIVAAFKPDVIHLHWMLWDAGVLDFLARYGKPVTVRVHTDTNHERLQMYAAHPAVRRIFGYPGDGQRFDFAHPKFVEMAIAVMRPAAVAVEKNRRLVLRAASENPRDQTLMVQLARRCPQFEFLLCIGESKHQDALGTRPALADALGAMPPPNLRIVWNESPANMAQWFARAGIYLHTFLPHKTAAMPVSIAEALVNGCYTLVRNQPRLMAMLGNTGAVYANEDEAAAQLAATLNWSKAEWQQKSADSRTAGERFCADRALLPMLEDWQQLSA